jgi:uncharacterized damage-inducible protein DinB
MRTFIVLAIVCASAAAPASAQSPSTGNPIASGVRTAWESGKQNLMRSAELMPESDYSFRPVDTVRTFGQILAHVAGANYVFCSAAKGEASPHAEAAFEKTATTRAQIIKALGESIAYCDAAYAALDDKRAGETVELPFGMGKGARALPLMMNSGHVQEHYGNLVTYFRIKGMVPPSSQPAK